MNTNKAMKAPKGAVEETEKALVDFLKSNRGMSVKRSEELGSYIVGMLLGKPLSKNSEFSSLGFSFNSRLALSSANRYITKLRRVIGDNDIYSQRGVKKIREAAHIVQAELMENYKYYGIKKRSQGYKSSVNTLSDIIDFSAKSEETLFYYVSRSIEALELVESSSHEAEFLAVLEPFFTLARKRVYRHPILNTLVLPDFESNEMKKTSQSNKDKKRSVDRFFFDKNRFLAWAERTMRDKSSTVEELMLAFAIATGRRMFAIGVWSEFKAIKRPDDTLLSVEENWIRQAYIPKKGVLSRDDSVDFISLIDSKLVMRTLKKIRVLAEGKSWNTDNNETFNNCLSYRFASVIETHFPDCVGSFTFKRSRDMYARMITARYNKVEYGNKMTDAMFIKEMCSHGSEATSATYEATDFLNDSETKPLEFWADYYGNLKANTEKANAENLKPVFDYIDSLIGVLGSELKGLKKPVDLKEINQKTRMIDGLKACKIALNEKPKRLKLTASILKSVASKNGLSFSSQASREVLPLYPKEILEEYVMGSGRKASSPRINFEALLV